MTPEAEGSPRAGVAESRAAGPPVDASGMPFSRGAAPRRIVSLVPSTTELLCDLGLADAIVGVTVYCVEPAPVVRTKTRVGGEKNPDLDAIRTLRPDLVIANVEENVRAHVDRLREWGIAVWVTYPRTVVESLRMIADLGEITGAERRAAEILDELRPLCERARADSARQPPTRVFYPIWRGPYMTINGDTYVSDVLALCGAQNVFAEHPARYPTITLDEVAAARPDAILLPDEPFRFRRRHLADFDPYPGVPAVGAGRLHLVDGKRFAWHGRRLAEALRSVPPLLDRGAS